jgi:hypothetical protein
MAQVAARVPEPANPPPPPRLAPGAEGFVDALRRAVRSHLSAIAEVHPNERLAGYALFTDNDLTQVVGWASTFESCARSKVEDVRWLPVRWPYGARWPLFAQPTMILRARYDDTHDARSVGAHVERSFADLLTVLTELREEGLVGGEVLLAALSIDPDPGFRARELEAAAALNPAELAGVLKAALRD